MIIESAVEAAIPQIMKKDCTLIREEEISRILSDGCNSILRNLGIPNDIQNIEVEKLYPRQNSRNEKRADLFISRNIFAKFQIETPELFHHTWVECKFLKHDKKTWDVKSLITDIRKLLEKGKEFAYLIVLMHHNLSNHSQKDIKLANLQKTLLSITKNTIETIYDQQSDLSNDENLPSLSNGSGLIEIKLRRTFSDIFPLKFNDKIEYYRFVTIKIFAEKINCNGYYF